MLQHFIPVLIYDDWWVTYFTCRNHCMQFFCSISSPLIVTCMCETVYLQARHVSIFYTYNLQRNKKLMLIHPRSLYFKIRRWNTQTLSITLELLQYLTRWDDSLCIMLLKNMAIRGVFLLCFVQLSAGITVENLTGACLHQRIFPTKF